MIIYNESEKYFHLKTQNSSYIINILPSKHVGHLYYGKKISVEKNAFNLNLQYQIEVGNQVIYDETDKTFNLNLAMLELSTYGKGDFRDPMLHFRLEDNSSITNFLYKSHEILPQKPSFSEMPETFGSDSNEIETLKITVSDPIAFIEIDLYYSVFYDIDVITRRTVIRNGSFQSITIEKAMSFNLDLLNQNYQILSLDGAWIRERQLTTHDLKFGLLKIDSKKGVSSNDHNPFIALKEKHTDEEVGACYGFSLLYSGNFEATLEVSPHSILRVLMGINSFDFSYLLEKEQTFVTPEAVLTYSDTGLSTLSQHFHDLVKKHIISKTWQNKVRPILINNWEATYFDFSERKLLKLARKAKNLGMELFVLDDGWFGKRNDDTSSLGDWVVNRAKLPSGISGIANKINKIGLDFGIWVEPEMVNPDSDLFRSHPEWAIQHPLRKPSLGRNQLILDLTNPDVRRYIIGFLTDLFQNANISYCKWDMNRNFSDVYSSYLPKKNQGSFFHLYTLGLYEILKEITSKFPNILFESCASGGNRYDLGMLYYMPQTWTSDNTDGIERLSIQYGTSFVYPLSTMGCHVSNIPNQQTLRKTPLETRFNTAIFGLLGYELDLTKLSRYEKKVIQKQVIFYKMHRELLQFGTMVRFISPFETNQCIWACIKENKEEAIIGVYQLLTHPNGPLEKIPMRGLNDELTYKISNRIQYFNLEMFGDLVKHALPIKLNANGILFHLLKNRYLMKAEEENVEYSGSTLNHFGFVPKQKFIGSGYNQSVRLMGDFGSRIYYISI
ncbi:MAG: alpha-galactosidase [Firmicutes bacterium]|nr:alpha-galactosidase [Bacillota bacterium]